MAENEAIARANYKEARAAITTRDYNDRYDIETVNHPPHYNNGSIECIDYLEDNLGREGFEYYLEGNIKKYMHRFRIKNKGAPVEDLRKAKWYLERLIQTLVK
jgi:hypothetical protein